VEADADASTAGVIFHPLASEDEFKAANSGFL
jgi:hypothetical protein